MTKIYEQLPEKEEWEKHGCFNNREWHEYLNCDMWRDFTPDIKDGCYIGTHESNNKRYKSEED